MTGIRDDEYNIDWDVNYGYNSLLNKYSITFRNNDQRIEAKGYFSEDEFREFAVGMINLIVQVKKPIDKKPVEVE